MRFPRVVATLCVLMGVRALAQDMGDRIEVQAHPHNIELAWEDTEDRLRGSITPGHVQAGEPMHVMLDVGSYDGKPFSGPVTFQLRRGGELYGSGVTVTNHGGWRADFSPDEPGPYSLDVSFRTTHLKVLHASFQVGEAGIPRVFLWILGAGLVLCVVGYVVLRQLWPQRPSAPPAEEAAPPR